MRLLAWLAHFFQRRCSHPGDHVSADILEGALTSYKGVGQSIQWCRLCGAYRFRIQRDAEGTQTVTGTWHQSEARAWKQ